MVRSLLAIAIFTFSGFAQDHPARASAGCGPSGVQYDVKSDKTRQPIASPESGKAALYVIQYERRDVEAFHIGAVTTRVGLDGTWQGGNHGQSYLLVPVDPGEHHLCVDWQSSLEERSKQGSAVTLTAEAGKVYYFRATVEQREKHPPAIVLETVDPAQGQFLISRSSLSKSHAKN
jgi:hypothetical protein